MTRRRSRLERAIEKIEVTGFCWNWTASLNQGGYGQLCTVRDGKTVAERAHRVMYEELVGPIPEGMHIDHLCRNRRCVNPDHLEPVTQAENNARNAGLGFGRLRMKDVCKNGHPLTDENVWWTSGRRRCRPCTRQWKREQNAREKAARAARRAAA